MVARQLLVIALLSATSNYACADFPALIKAGAKSKNGELLLKGEKITDAAILELRDAAEDDLNGIESLVIENTKLTAAGMKELKKLKNVKSLLLQGSNISDESLMAFSHLKLDSIGIVAGRITDDGLKTLDFSKSKDVTLTGGFITNKGIEYLISNKKIPICQNLDLSQTYVNSKSIAFLEGIKDQLKTLKVASTDVDDDSIEHINNLKINILSLSATKVTDEGLRKLKCKSLEDLDIRYLKNLTDRGIENLPQMNALKSLSLKGCVKVTMIAEMEFHKKLPNCRVTR